MGVSHILHYIGSALGHIRHKYVLRGFRTLPLSLSTHHQHLQTLVEITSQTLSVAYRQRGTDTRYTHGRAIHYVDGYDSYDRHPLYCL